MKASKIIACTMLAALGACMASFSRPSCCAAVEPGRVDSLTVESALLPQPMRVNVALPAQYLAEADTASYPVVYLLNGHGGNCNNWGGIVPLDSIASAYGMIIVTPSGMTSWYFDAPAKPEMQMESFIIRELVPFIDATYRTRPEREARAVTGFSMGGHGALWLAIRHPEVFGSAGSSSGGVDFTPFPKKWNLPDMLGEAKANADVWRSHTVMSQLDKLEPGEINIIFDCGTSDFFYGVNCALDSALNARGIYHTYITGPGTHNGEYWRRAVYPQLDMFKSVFSK